MKNGDKNSYRYVAKNLERLGVIERSIAYEGGEFSQKISYYPELIICGGGHVAYALSIEAKRIGFRVTVIDDREDFANKKRFPHVDTVICSDFASALDSLERKNVWYAIMSRGHKSDELCAEHILNHKSIYVGMMGSKHKIKFTKQTLLDNGFSQEKIDSMYAPIGLSIGAQTPEEIAVCIAAQLIQVKSNMDCNYLDENVLKTLRENKASMVITTIIEKKGSAPRDVGSSMVVFEDGSIAGTIGGGAVEAAAIKEGQKMAMDATPFVKDYGLTNEDAANIGMVCGGKVRVLFERVLKDQ